jgi:MOSC domain-containing protein YiiM
VTANCTVCGFDAGEWRPADADSFLNAFDMWWELATAGASVDLADLKSALSRARDDRDVHEVIHRQMDVAAALRPSSSYAGRVEQINASGGGVPKLPVDRGTIGFAGLEGDRQADRKHHGRQFQALCLWSTEVLDELKAAGHPIGPGFAGENLTLSGVDWPRLRPGTNLRLGTALAEVSFPATPCGKQARWFTDGDFKRIDHGHNPQWVRWYAWVREPGVVAPGDTVLVQN